MKKALVILVGFIVVLVGLFGTSSNVSAQELQANTAKPQMRMLSENTARKLEVKEAMNLLAAYSNNRTENIPGIPQARATIEVTSLPSGETHVTFQTLDSMPSGSYLIFRMFLPNGVFVYLNGFMVESTYRWGALLWQGNFPGVWPNGWTRYEVYLGNSNGELSYISTLVNFQACCGPQPGPIKTAEVSLDGLSIDIKGNFSPDMVVTLNGLPAPVAFEYDPNTGEPIAKIINQYSMQGQATLTACSNGVCSTRVVYITLGPSTPIGTTNRNE